MESARLDGAGELLIFIRIGIPLGSAGIISALVLGFLEYWNLIEQPMAFLKTKSLWPLSLYLPQIDISQTGKAFAVSVLVLIPAVIVFLAGRIIWNKGSYPRQSRNRATETRGFIYEENKTDKNSGRIFCPDAFVYFSVQGGRFGECSTGRDKNSSESGDRA